MAIPEKVIDISLDITFIFTATMNAIFSFQYLLEHWISYLNPTTAYYFANQIEYLLEYFCENYALIYANPTLNTSSSIVHIQLFNKKQKLTEGTMTSFSKKVTWSWKS